MTRTKEPATAIGDPERIEAFAGQTVARLASAWTIAAIHIGDRLGLYKALAKGPASSASMENAAVNPSS